MSGVKYYLESPVTLRESGRIFDYDEYNVNEIVEKFIHRYLFLKKEDGIYSIRENTKGVLGVVSELGTGKSFFLNMLYEKLRYKKLLRELLILLEKQRNDVFKNYKQIDKLEEIRLKVLDIISSTKFENFLERENLENFSTEGKIYEKNLILLEKSISLIDSKLKKDCGYEVVYIDIPKYQYEPDIFFVIYKELYNQLMLYEQIKDYIKINIEVIYKVLQKASRYNKEIKKVFNYINTIKDLYNAFNDSFSKIDYLKKFKFSDQREKIIEIAEKLENKQIFIIIDNLEKAKPEFIVDFLFKMEEIFFSFDNWLFIITFDKNELEKILQRFYGKIDLIGFFKKFIIFEFNIDRFFEQNRLLFGPFDLNKFYYKVHSSNLLSNSVFSIRLKKILELKNTFFQKSKIFDSLNREERFLAYMLILLNIIDEELYKKLFNSVLLKKINEDFHYEFIIGSILNECRTKQLLNILNECIYITMYQNNLEDLLLDFNKVYSVFEKIEIIRG